MPVVVVLTRHTATRTLILQHISTYSDTASLTFDGIVQNTCHMFCKKTWLNNEGSTDQCWAGTYKANAWYQLTIAIIV